MDMAADFIIGIWVVAVKVATVGVGTAGGIGLTGSIWGGRHRLGNYPHLIPSFHWCPDSPFHVHLLGH